MMKLLVLAVFKKMNAFFTSNTSHVAKVALEDRRTANADWHTSICMPDVIVGLEEKNTN